MNPIISSVIQKVPDLGSKALSNIFYGHHEFATECLCSTKSIPHLSEGTKAAAIISSAGHMMSDGGTFDMMQ